MIALALTWQLAVWLALLMAFLGSRSGSMFHPFFYYLIFHGLVFVIRPLMGYLLDFQNVYFLMQFYPTEGDYVLTCALTTGALLVFGAVSWFLSSPTPSLKRPVPLGFNLVEWEAFSFVLVLLGPVALYSMFIGLGAFSVENSFTGNSPFEMLRDANTGVIGFTNTTGYFVDAQLVILPLCIMFAWGNRFRLMSFLPLILFLGNRFYTGWARWTFVFPVFTVALLLMTRHKWRWLPARYVVLVIPLFLVFQLLGDNRDYFHNLITGYVAEVDPIEANKTWLEKQDNQDFANFDFLTYVVDAVPDKSHTYTYFTQYLQLFTEPVPRILWPGKPFGPPINLINLDDYGNFIGWTVSLVGDGWMSLGWLGMIITMAAVAYACKRMYRWFCAGELTNYKILVYCIFAPLTLQWFRDGGISIAKFSFWTIGPIILWHLMVGFFSSNPQKMLRVRRLFHVVRIPRVG